MPLQPKSCSSYGLCLSLSLILTSRRWCSRIFTFFSLASSSPLPAAFSITTPLCCKCTHSDLKLLQAISLSTTNLTPQHPEELHQSY